MALSCCERWGPSLGLPCGCVAGGSVGEGADFVDDGGPDFSWQVVAEAGEEQESCAGNGVRGWALCFFSPQIVTRNRLLYGQSGRESPSVRSLTRSAHRVQPDLTNHGGCVGGDSA